MNAAFPDPIQTRIHGWDGENAIYILEHFYRVNTSSGWVTIPAGTISDGLSIPAWAWLWVGPANGRAFGAGLLHDFLYSCASDRHCLVTRKQADDLFLEAMWNLGIGWKRNLIWAAVRSCGWKFYKRK
jgi:hypothetical protein